MRHMCRMPDLATLVVYVVGVFLDYLVPSRVFEVCVELRVAGNHRFMGVFIVCQMRPA
ncbi:hypothetical protein ACLK1S_09120 [Escherichia coli]